jgi:hypothetical protein
MASAWQFRACVPRNQAHVAGLRHDSRLKLGLEQHQRSNDGVLTY